MTKERIEQLVIGLDTQIDRVHKQIDFLQSLTDLETIPGGVSASNWYPYEVEFFVSNMEGLHQMREYLRKQFGTWKDKLYVIWASYGKANAVWTGKTPSGIEVHIHLVCLIPDFPTELQKDGCGFREVAKTEMEFVCEKE